jgi:hypothetical protein
MNLTIRKFIATFLVVIYSTTQVVLGSAAEANFWAERRRSVLQQKDAPTQLAALPVPLKNGSSPNALLQQLPTVGTALPTIPKWSASRKNKNQRLPRKFQALVDAISLSYGSVQDLYKSPLEEIPPVVLIQDVHLNNEAQNNIAQLLQGLIDQKQIGLVGVEGAFVPFDFAPFRAFPDKKITHDVTQAFVDKNLLAAPSFVGITSATEPPPFMGVDDRPHYDANVNAYLATRAIKKKVVNQINELKRTLSEEKKNVFSRELLRFDELRAAHNSGTLGLGTYVKQLKENLLSPSPYPRPQGAGNLSFAIDQFLEAYEMESTLDFKRVESQRRTVIEKLTKKLSEAEISNLMAESLAYRLGQMSFGDYYQGLKNLCERKGWPQSH